MPGAGRFYSHLIQGDSIVLGDAFGQPGSLLLQSGTREARLTVEGNATVGSLDVHSGLVRLFDGLQPTDPVTISLDPSTGVIDCQDLTIDGVPLAEYIASVALIDTDGVFPNVILDQVNHLVPGQADTFYIDKGATTRGYNVKIDSVSNLPKFRLLRNGAEMLLGTDYTIVRSLSNAGEGPAAVGSFNAIQILEPLILQSDRIWYAYTRGTEASA
jgi:hypothetical protein